MNTSVRDKILNATGATELVEKQKLQDLWSGYGTLKRYELKGSQYPSIIVKHVAPPRKTSHSRGWDTALSHRRKLRSYQVESHWYAQHSVSCHQRCRVPNCIALECSDDQFFIVLEDLDAVGFEVRKTSVDIADMRACLKWLAHFHATFLGQSADGLWETGTYWHLETRPDELQALKDKDLKFAATAIDRKLSECRYQTFVHGDAKLANFCFSKDGKKVAAVDFQYVGGGCGMKDIAYFIGSCLEEDDCERHESELLEYYFSVLGNTLRAKKTGVGVGQLCDEWRALYPVAWADFHRFIKGWSPGHWKIHSYSERITREVIEQLR